MLKLNLFSFDIVLIFTYKQGSVLYKRKIMEIKRMAIKEKLIFFHDTGFNEGNMKGEK
jgi:hypothetical protein